MGRLPIRLGLILLIVGMVGAGYASWPGARPADRPLIACGPGETGTIEPRPAASGAKDAPEGLQVVCVDRQGTRRVVAEGMQALPGAVMSRLGWLLYTLLFAFIAALGLLLILLGLIARRRTR